MVLLHRFWAARPVQQFLACFARPNHARRRPAPPPSASARPSSASPSGSGWCLAPTARTCSSGSTDPPPPHATPSVAGCRRIWPWSAFLAVGINLIRQRWCGTSPGHAHPDSAAQHSTRGGVWEIDLVRGLCSLAIVQPGKKGWPGHPTGSAPPNGSLDSGCVLPLSGDGAARESKPSADPTESPPSPSTDEGWQSDDESIPRRPSPDLAQAEQDLWATGHRLLARLQGLQALAQLDQGHWSTGLALLTRAAQAGDAESQHNLGYVYEMGLGGVAVDLRQALDWYEAAASQDYPPSVYNVGVFYESGTIVPQDLNRAQILFQKAQALEQRSGSPPTTPDCDRYPQNLGSSSNSNYDDPTLNLAGDPRSIHLLARAYQYGLSGMPADVFFALELYREAAKRHYAPAQAAFQTLFAELDAKTSENKGLARPSSLSDIPDIPQSEFNQPGLAMPSSQSLTALNSLITEEESAIFLS
ncbi:hypothetical protein TCAL_07757 [Tigriopus californicus]|uniref:Uncharacterized protein n=1 Tax=Tigriopus californicus TaxID=6832 RepID=A0A553P7U9_TIGCA|nr:hypothetical protein TCAL_07757 [Tigriopus californicus]|eukprot:TCALIF_07757-PA protein Name:"Similar to podJ Localization factor PodJL (Caulobacter crescentus (strain ATCC 19089 / CB15))" AED:0.30 eAED:0.43 QI:0/-1/0/1/-1/1/1/0/472